MSTEFVINDNPDQIEKDADGNELYHSDFDENADKGGSSNE